MISYKGAKYISVAVLATATLVGVSGCQMGGGSNSGYSASAAPVGGPSATGTTFAQTTRETSGAGAAEAPGGTQQGAEASSFSAQNAGAQTSTNMVIPLYQESLQVGTREVNDGAVRIQKHVTTETVNQPVELRKETVTVDRVPAGSQAAQSAAAANQAQAQPFQNQDIVIQLHHEEPVVSKQIMPEGEIVARVRTQLQQTNVQGQVRREQVHVSEQGNPQNVVISRNLANSTSTAGMGGGGEVGGQSQGTATGTSGAPITDATTLTATQDPASLAGRPVQLSGLRVEQVLGNHLLAVTNSSGKRLFVRVDQPIQNLQAGDMVSLTGTVNRVPSVTANLGLDPQASQALEGQPIYLDAQQVRVANH